MTSKSFTKRVYEPKFVLSMDWGAWSSPQFSVLYQASYTDTFTGTELPGWRGLIRSGNNATTGAGGTKANHKIGGGYAQLTYDSAAFPIRRQGRAMQGAIIPPVYASSPSGFALSAADTQARLAFLSEYRSRRTTFQSGTFFGELAETVRMLSSPAKALRRGIDAYHSTARSRAAKEWATRAKNKVVAETWLEYSFGFAPLLNDIHDAQNLLAASPSKYLQKISGSATVELSKTFFEASASHGFLRFWYRLMTVGSVSVRYKGAVSAEVSPPGFAEQVGVNFSNFVPTIWNLIPYSFLVDYFTNIGKVIDGVSQGNIQLAWGCRTTRKISRCTCCASGIDWEFAKANAAAPSGYVNVSGYLSEITEFGRSAVDFVGAGVSDFQFRIPGIGSTKWLNIAALARLKTL